MCSCCTKYLNRQLRTVETGLNDSLSWLSITNKSKYVTCDNLTHCHAGTSCYNDVNYMYRRNATDCMRNDSTNISEFVLSNGASYCQLCSCCYNDVRRSDNLAHCENDICHYYCVNCGGINTSVDKRNITNHRQNICSNKSEFLISNHSLSVLRNTETNVNTLCDNSYLCNMCLCCYNCSHCECQRNTIQHSEDSSYCRSKLCLLDTSNITSSTESTKVSLYVNSICNMCSRENCSSMESQINTVKHRKNYSNNYDNIAVSCPCRKLSKAKSDDNSSYSNKLLLNDSLYCHICSCCYRCSEEITDLSIVDFMFHSGDCDKNKNLFFHNIDSSYWSQPNIPKCNGSQPGAINFSHNQNESKNRYYYGSSLDKLHNADKITSAYQDISWKKLTHYYLL